MRIVLLIIICLASVLHSGAQTALRRNVSGVVYEDGESPKPLPGAVVSLKGNTAIGTVTDDRGMFSLDIPDGSDPVLLVSFIGFQTQEMVVSGNPQGLSIYLEPKTTELEGVDIVSTGYQELPLERATGSFVLADKALINRRVSTNILERLEDVTPGLVFNRDGASGRDPISIRGRATLFANTSPLIVLDNFPYDGSIDNINPNDVESISVLRDAAAASIWGAKAGNGVIVITTKSGKRNSDLRISLNSNVRVSEPVDLFYQPLMVTSDVVDMTQTLFDRGYYLSAENSLANVALPPLVEDLIAHRDGNLSDAQLAERIQTYRNFDVRSQLMEYYYRRPVYLQNSLQLSGGKEVHSYSVSVGWDNTLQSIRGNKEDRLTLNFQNSWTLAEDRLEFNLGLYQTGGGRTVTTELPFTSAQPGYAYEPLADAEGRPLPITYNLRNKFVDKAAESGLLDWRFTPLDEIGLLDQQSKTRDTRINTGIGYRILDGLKVQALYQYWESASESTVLRPETSYFSRNLINSYTQRGAGGTLSYPIPMGSIKDYQEGRGFSHQLRTLISYRKIVRDHDISALGGFEVKRLANKGYNTRFYGYDKEIGSTVPVDYVTRFPNYAYAFNTTTIPYLGATQGTEDRYRSWFANAGYLYREKYQVSGSVRTDASNLFGVETNQKKVPLWSVGGGWYLHEEGFYRITWLPYLKLRYTYGYNGNIDRSMSAYLTARYFPAATNNLISGIPLPYAQVINPPNPELRWEKIAISNWGMDFATQNKWLAGTLEFYKKKGMDLIGDAPLPPSSGVRNFRGNYADTETWGFDFSLTSNNLPGELTWTTNWFISYVSEKVTKYAVQRPVRDYMLYGSDVAGAAYPLEGKPLFGIYSYPWAGLDPQDGQPLGVLEGTPSKDYAMILSSADVEDITYHGSGRPLYFGSLRNSLAYKGLSLSFNISYRFKYYYRRSSVNYNSVLSGLRSHSDFGQRWQNPGDEMITSVPALPEVQNSNRELFYQNSSVLVEKGDHIRLQDITVNYRFPVGQGRHLRELEIYGYVDNLGIIWKASDDELDPDYRTTRPLTSVALGIRLGL